MIQNVLTILTQELNAHLKRQFNSLEESVILSEIVHQDGSLAFSGDNKIICSLINIEQERVNLNVSMAKSVKTNPPINLNIYIMFSAYFPGNYEESLKFLSSLIGFFQGKQVFNHSNTPGLDDAVEKISVDMVNMDLHQVSNLWAAVGAKAMPFVAFKLRMLSISRDVILDIAPEITKLETSADPN